jgi:hypothetical protein
VRPTPGAAGGSTACASPARVPWGTASARQTDPAGNVSDPTVKALDTPVPQPQPEPQPQAPAGGAPTPGTPAGAAAGGLAVAGLLAVAAWIRTRRELV